MKIMLHHLLNNRKNNYILCAYIVNVELAYFIDIDIIFTSASKIMYYKQRYYRMLTYTYIKYPNIKKT